MKRIGIDVGGTNTDAALLDGNQVIAAVKTFTTSDITSGVRTALRDLLAKAGDAADDVMAVMIGTTHFTNAVVERRNLGRAAAIRVSLPASASLVPFCDWPKDLAAKVNGGVYLVEGGHEYDGRPLVPMDEAAVARAARQIRADGVKAVAISATFSPLTAECEERAAEIVRNEAPDVHLTLSSTLGRIGLLERENVALMNASLIGLARETTQAFVDAVASSGLKAQLFITQNDGTVVLAEAAREFPVFSFASGPTNSMRGAALLAGIEDAMVCDVGGTTADIGCLVKGFPREANNVVEVGGVRTLFRMPDLLSIAIGGGTVIGRDPLTVGPQSVGYRLGQEALVFGGDTVTATDIAVASGLLDLGDASRVAGLSAEFVKSALAKIHASVAENVDRMKTDATEVPLLAVGGGAMLIPEAVPGISEVVHVPYHEVANAVGAAMAQISGETDRIYRDMDREDAIAAAREAAIAAAVEAGADAATIKVIDVEDLPLSYLPGRAIRTRVRVVGEARAMRRDAAAVA
ncbi:hydantoinase/oxoprolinase N-terminal domain-containing protein [Tropicimonas sp. IMCC6043]|uniref:hydantoinase/oxoprolinase N-terminal domain-containing protein n=1 Tax=Tropicimonas sp. IMCC6043 TaxID=2510645 RepID=UPI00101C0D19|nr:hydantoinase/oxoprolinase family protein [Tropicimonas sp. IMCC6043]RYH12316.1 hydantoinase/oxoprolinase family protein [Tropicimonas sp. IMCC6043]